jgi:transcriptional regulator with XRE-family HTH domain
MPKADRTPIDRLRRERERRGWSGDDLAGRMRDVAERQGERAVPQVDATTIYRWERGEQRPTRGTYGC